jgi:hypothetical protein
LGRERKREGKKEGKKVRGVKIIHHRPAPPLARTEREVSPKTNTGGLTDGGGGGGEERKDLQPESG